MLKILCVGPQWRGSNAGGMFRALSRIGNIIEIIDENYFINLSNKNLITKSLDTLFRKIHINEFNREIIQLTNRFKPQVILVYKGAFVLPETLIKLKKANILLANFYPDVSFRTHGNLLAKTLPLYDHVFTTKTFGIRDMKDQLGITQSTFIPHGFDPDIHRTINIKDFNYSYYENDCSFIGGYSEKKVSFLSELKKNVPELNLKIWGGRWNNYKNDILNNSLMRSSVLGDEYVIGILASKINLGLLHEQVEGASSGDQITSRTFHIPGAGGFMLHEKTNEAIQYFKEDEEAVFFSNAAELIEKVKYYLKNESERERIRINGHNRAVKDHSLDIRAKQVTQIINSIL